MLIGYVRNILRGHVVRIPIVMSSITHWAALEPLKYADFRVLTVVSALNSVGMMAGQVALGWYVLQLTDSAFMVGLVIALRMLPNLFLGIPAGAVADLG